MCNILCDHILFASEVSQQEKKFIKTLTEKYESCLKMRIGETRKVNATLIHDFNIADTWTI